MKIDGHEIREDELVLIARPFTLKDYWKNEEFYITPCQICHKALIICEENVEIINTCNIIVSCPLCALHHWPDMIAGRNPDTGQFVTLREIANYPNLVGAYGCEDIM